MLYKLFGKKKSNNLSRALVPSDRGPRAVKIIHPGGHAEYYYMAIPAARIMEKYPSFTLTRPDIFRRPWGSTVRPDEVLLPGQKFYVVPSQTVKKLRRQMKKSTVGFSHESGTSVDAQNDKDSQSSISVSGILVKPGPKSKTRNGLHVRFFGVDSTTPSDGKTLVQRIEKGSEGTQRKRRARNQNGWEPSLNSVSE